MADLYTFKQLKEEYTHMWTHMEINHDRVDAAQKQAQKIIAGKAKYIYLEVLTGVPWYFIGLLHLRESSCDFTTHLHNGDPLNENGKFKRTVHVPAKRPLAPPKDGQRYTFEESAIDALTRKGYNKIKNWSIEQMAFCLEKYNGFGYRMRNKASAYLWASSNQYTGGKFIFDGPEGWRPNVYDTQLGAMVVLKCLIDMIEEKPIIEKPLVVTEELPNTPTADMPRPTTKELAQTSRKFNVLEWQKYIFGTGGVGGIAAAVSGANMWSVLILVAAAIIVFAFTIWMQKLIKDDVQEGRYIPSKEAE